MHRTLLQPNSFNRLNFVKRMMFPVLLLMLFASTTQAWELNGRFKIDAIANDARNNTLEDLVDYKNSSEFAGQLRMEWIEGYQAWQFNAAWQLDGRYGSAVKRDHLLADEFAGFASSFIGSSYQDLQDNIDQSEYGESFQMIDRLYLNYTKPNYVLRFGRQALTWGSGLVFHPMDLVNPFQPVANDTAYKTGTDMFYGQWLFDNGSDIQMAIVPQRESPEALNLNGVSKKNSYALFVTSYYGALQWNLLLAQDFDDRVVGLGVSGSLAGAAWNMELVPTQLEHDGTKTSLLLNISQATTLWKRNLNNFAEYYHSGLGESNRPYSLSQLNAPLLNHLLRGQQFVTGRDYLALGTNWQWSPLLVLTPTVIVNLHDSSSLFDFQFNYSLSDNFNLKGGLQLPFGSEKTEFGGLELFPRSNLFFAVERQLYCRAEVYF